MSILGSRCFTEDVFLPSSSSLRVFSPYNLCKGSTNNKGPTHKYIYLLPNPLSLALNWHMWFPTSSIYHFRLILMSCPIFIYCHGAPHFQTKPHLVIIICKFPWVKYFVCRLVSHSELQQIYALFFLAPIITDLSFLLHFAFQMRTHLTVRWNFWSKKRGISCCFLTLFAPLEFPHIYSSQVPHF